MKHFNKSLMAVCVLALTASSWAIPWPMWEFNTNGDLEGWGRTGNGQISQFEVRDGRLVVGVVAAAGDAFINGPTGPYNADEVTGFFAKMHHSIDPTGAGSRQFFMFPRGATHQWISWEPPTIDPLNGVVYVDLTADGVEKWKDQINNIRYDFSNLPEAYTVEIDWVRPEGLYIGNEGFEYWDMVNDRIRDWNMIGAEANFNFNEQTTVDSLLYALALTGSGAEQGLSQPVKGGADMEVGTGIIVLGSVNIPTASWDADSKLTVRVREKTGGADQVSEVDVDVTTRDQWVEFVSDAINLQTEAAERTDVTIEIMVVSPANTVVYLDTVFVNAIAPPKIMGWPVNCVKLAAGQEITIDGIVTAAEYQGAQAMVVNADTAWNVEDPHTPRYLHQMRDLFGGQWGATPLDDFNATYYMMWDDTALYVAVYCQDDNYQPAGPNANDGDALQFTITETNTESEHGFMYIPTIAPRDESGQAVAKNDYPGAFIQTDLFAHEGTQYAGFVDDASQNWMVEVKIPWAALQGAFKGDLAQGDADGDGKDVFPPAVLDRIGFNVIVIDYDVDFDGNPQLQVIGSTHPGDWPWSPWPWSEPDTVTQETMTFIEASAQ